MNIEEIIAAIDAEISRLTKARQALTDTKITHRKSGRKPMSAAARRKISQAQKARWAKQKAK